MFLVVTVVIAYHKPGRRHWLEQRGHKAGEAGGERSRSVSGSVQKAWPGTAAREATPSQEERVHVTRIKVSGRLITATIAFLVFLIVDKTTVEMYLHDGIESRLQTSEMLLFDLDTLLDLFL